MKANNNRYNPGIKATKIKNGGILQMPNTLRKRLYTLKEAALYLGRSEWEMRELIWADLIPVVKRDGGRKYFFDLYDLEEFRKNNKHTFNNIC